MKPITENIIEQSAIELLQSQGWEYANGRELSPEGLFLRKRKLPADHSHLPFTPLYPQ